MVPAAASFAAAAATTTATAAAAGAVAGTDADPLLAKGGTTAKRVESGAIDPLSELLSPSVGRSSFSVGGSALFDDTDNRVRGGLKVCGDMLRNMRGGGWV